MNRRNNIDSLQHQLFDLVIIGGGITGAGILLEAAKNGYSCLLLEKGDFASGTSSKSAKLIHGGIRYLKYGQIGMVRESLEERNHLMKTYPHLVKPLPFLFPVYDSTFKYRVGMAIYHFLSNDETLPDYRYMETEEIIRLFPAINAEGLRGGFIYYDAITNDARLCNEVIDDAQLIEGNHAVNYCEVVSMEKREKTVLVKAHDHLENVQRTYEARYIVNASGVWTDEVLKRTTKKETNFSAPSRGVHLILSRERFPCENAVIIPTYAKDNRLNYSVPWENNSVIIGTTDTDYLGDLDHPGSGEEDIEYLIQSLQKFAPSLNITKQDVIHVYSGLRPMYNNTAPSYERSRDYHIWWEDEVMLNILGGKLTSYHSMAESLVEELAKKFPVDKINVDLDKYRTTEATPDLPREFTDGIYDRLLDKASEVFTIARENKSFTEQFHPDYDATLAEAIFYIRKMQCYHLNDLLGRRLSLTYVLNGCKEKDAVINKAAILMQQECGWTKDELNKELQDYYNILNSSPQTTQEKKPDNSGSAASLRISKC